ncbi:MAG: LCP family protein [Christensenellales bacterium]
MARRLGCFLLSVLLSLLLLTGCAEETLSDQELTDLLYELSQQDDEADFLVLPEDYQMPAAGVDGVYRLLILGVDTDDPKVAGRSDTMILAVMDRRQHTLKLVSFMRDLYVKIPGRGHNRLNAAFAFGGEQLLRRTLQEAFGVVADGYLAVNFSLMADLVDALGGVTMQVEAYELGPLNGILSYYNYQRGLPEEQGILTASGQQLLTGLQTMSYARIRKTDSDFVRVTRQQRVMEAIYHRMQDAGAQQLLDIALRFAPLVKSDVTPAQAASLLRDLMGMGDISISTLRVPADKAFASRIIHDAFFLVPNLDRNRGAIADFLAPPP